MPSTGAVDVFVDVDELGRVRSELQNLITQLDDLEYLEHEPEAAEFGGGDVADAASSFMVRWNTERRKLVDRLRGCAQYIDLAVQQYEATEDLLTGSLQPVPTTAGESTAP